MKYYLSLAALLCCCSLALAMGNAPVLPSLSNLQEKIAADLVKMDSSLAQAAAQLGTTGLNGSDTGKILQKLYNDNPATVTAATIGLNGQLLQIQPRTYQNSQGSNISQQEHFQRLQKTQQPVLGGVIKMVEGFYAAALAYPVSQNGKTIGYVSLVFKPDALIGKIIKPYLPATSETEVMALELDGHIIYDHDILQIGKKTFVDPAYQNSSSLLALAKKIIATPSGTGNYSYVTKTGQAPVKKASEWTTVALHGTEWRLVVSKPAE